jgi:hypothetical protein
VRGKISGETEERDIMQPVVGWEFNRGQGLPQGATPWIGYRN